MYLSPWVGMTTNYEHDDLLTTRYYYVVSFDVITLHDLNTYVVTVICED